MRRQKADRGAIDTLRTHFVYKPIPTVRAYHNANQNVNNSVWQALALNSERWDVGALHNVALNNSRLTCVTQPGEYAIYATAYFDVNATGSRGLAIRLNGVTYIASNRGMADTTAGQGSSVAISTNYVFAITDYVELMAWQSSAGGGVLAMVALPNMSPEFGMRWQGS